MSHWQHPCCSHNDTGSINCCIIYFILNRAAIYKRKRRKDLKQRSCARCFTGSTEVFLIHIFLYSLWYTQNISLWQDTLLVEDFCQLIMLRAINHRENASIWTQRELSVNYKNLEKRGISSINDFFEWKQIYILESDCPFSQFIHNRTTPSTLPLSLHPSLQVSNWIKSLDRNTACVCTFFTLVTCKKSTEFAICSQI